MLAVTSSLFDCKSPFAALGILPLKRPFSLIHPFYFMHIIIPSRLARGWLLPSPINSGCTLAFTHEDCCFLYSEIQKLFLFFFLSFSSINPCLSSVSAQQVVLKRALRWQGEAWTTVIFSTQGTFLSFDSLFPFSLTELLAKYKEHGPMILFFHWICGILGDLC